MGQSRLGEDRESDRRKRVSECSLGSCEYVGMYPCCPFFKDDRATSACIPCRRIPSILGIPLLSTRGAKRRGVHSVALKAIGESFSEKGILRLRSG